MRVVKSGPKPVPEELSSQRQGRHGWVYAINCFPRCCRHTSSPTRGGKSPRDRGRVQGGGRAGQFLG